MFGNQIISTGVIQSVRAQFPHSEPNAWGLISLIGPCLRIDSQCQKTEAKDKFLCWKTDCLVTTEGVNDRELPWELKSMVWEGLDPVTDPY